MARRKETLAEPLRRLSGLLARLPAQAGVTAVPRLASDAAALLFHLDPPAGLPSLVAILGGTGTGKSTLLNRLLGHDISATSFRRTFTAGAVAVVDDPEQIAQGWLGVPVVVLAPQELPARGAGDQLTVVALGGSAETSAGLAGQVTLVDTPDLDGDQPAHHAQADRVFRWCQAVLFLVTPEKYQMTELLPYYRLSRRYAVPAVFVMNKCDEPAQVLDYARVLKEAGFAAGATPASPTFAHGRAAESSALPIFAVPRDDAAYEAPGHMNLEALRQSIAGLRPAEPPARQQGLENRRADLVNRIQDQLLGPLEQAQREGERTAARLRAMVTAAPGVDVNPITLQLQRRLQQRSVLYLMGPGRVLDRVRQVPSLVARLPRTAWELLRGHSVKLEEPPAPAQAQQVPDFRQVLVDQFTVLQSRVDAELRGRPLVAGWIESDPAGYAEARIDPEQAGRIVDEELADLRRWLQERWDATPRDTMLIQKLLKHLPGGQKLTQWTEAAPYLLVIVTVANNAFLGPIDLIAIGGYGVVTWVMERLSNEVTARTRLTNRRIGERFASLAGEQIEQSCRWLASSGPDRALVRELRDTVERI